MSVNLKEIEAQAMQLSLAEWSELTHRLITSLDGEAPESPEAVAKAWNEEIARRMAEIDAGTAVLIPHEQVLAEMEELLMQARN
jgi:hypothetical protein